jgi:hypothetical protein
MEQEHPKTITVTGPVILQLSSDQLNVVLRGLEQLPFGQVRPVFSSIEAQIVEQMNRKSIMERLPHQTNGKTVPEADKILE